MIVIMVNFSNILTINAQKTGSVSVFNNLQIKKQVVFYWKIKNFKYQLTLILVITQKLTFIIQIKEFLS